MGYRRRLVTWSITGAVRHLAMFGAALAAALVLVGAVVIVAGSIVTRAMLATADRTADREWSEALAPLSTVPERYPATETDDRALRLEAIADSIGIRLAAGGAPQPPRPTAGVDPARLASAVALLLAGDPPVWATDVTDCSAAPATSERGHLELQRLLLSTAGRAIAQGQPATAREILEASWRLNEALLRSPCLDCHLAACTIVEQQMALLGELPEPGDEWRVRLAALDLVQHTLEAYRFEAWRARCLAGHHFADLHPAASWLMRPLARLAAHQQHEAMLFAVRELPRRDLRSFDADAFVAEQHARVSRANPVGQSTLPHDWTSWPRSLRATLSVDLALRVLELRAAARAGGREAVSPQPRQPSRLAGVDWLYEAVPGGVTITIDSAGWPEMAERPLRAVVSLRSAALRGGGA